MKKILLFTSILFLTTTSSLFAQHPTALLASNITSTSVDLNWDASICAGNVNLKYKIVGGSWNPNINGVTSPHLLSGLLANTDYEWTVKCVGASGWQATELFTTLSTPAVGPTIDTAFISQPILCNGAVSDGMQINIAQTSPITTYSAVIGFYVGASSFVSYLSTNQTTTVTLNLTGFNPDVDYCIRIVDSAAYYSANGGSASGTSTVGMYDEFCTINFLEPAQLVASTSVVSSNLCAGDCIAAEDLLITGGTGPYSFTINGGASQNLAAGDSTYSFIALCAGNYDVIATDANGCSTSPSTTTFIIAPIPTIVPSGTVSLFNLNGYHVSCNGASDGIITASASGGTGVFTYSIDGTNFLTSDTFTGLSAGPYTITYKDANDCIATESFVLNEPPALSGTANVTQNVDCFGLSTGEITFTVDPAQPGVPAYQYSIDNGVNFQSSNIFSNLTGNLNYALMIEDNNACQFTSIAVYLAEPTQIIYSTTLSDYNSYEVSCDGVSDGSIDFTNTIGGLAPYEYSTDGGVTFNIATLYSSLSSGIYNIEVKDASGCIVLSTDTLYAPGIFSVPHVVSNAIVCHGDCNGAISINPSNSVGTVVYSLSPGPAQTTPYFPGLCDGSYDLNAVDDNGCIATVTAILLTEPPAFVYTTASNLDDFCAQSTGQASITVTGGTGSLLYLWDDGATQSSSVAINLASGTYSVLVTDQNNCNFTESVNVLADEGFTVSFTTVSPCLGDSSGSATVSATGISPLSYQWSDANGIIAGETSSTISGMPIGTYSLEIIDNTTCVVVGSVNITPTVNPIVIDSLVITNSSCFGIDDAQIEIFSSGGQAPFTFSNSNGLNNFPNPVFGMLSADTYVIQAIDGNGCFDDTTITLSYPDLLEIDSTVFTDISCFGLNDGAIQNIQFVGGTGPFEFSIDGGPHQTYMLFSGLDPGQHTVEVFDVNNCASSDFITVTEPTLFEVGITVSDWNNYQIRCNGDNSGYVDVNATGGTLPYYTIYNQFYFSPNFTVNGNTLDTAFFSLNPVYIYSWDSTANILDSTITNSLTILQFNDANNPTAVTDSFVAYASNLDVYTFDSLGNITDTTYFPADSTWLVSYYYLTGIDTAFGANSQMTGFPQGNHTFIVEDANGCNYTETIIFNEPSPIQHNFITNHVTCVAWNNGSVTDSVSGGVGSATTYSYLWTTGDTTFQLTDSTTYSLDNLQVDTYTITVTDENGCEDTASVIINDDYVFKVDSLSGLNVGCFDDCDGELSVVASDGVPFTGSTSYNYLWNDYLGQSTALAVGLCVDSITLSTDYYCVVSDAVGCSDTVYFTLTQPEELKVDITILDPISCFGLIDGKLKANVTGGTPTYTYSWSNGITTPISDNLSPGVYKVTIEDANTCRDTFEIYLEEPTLVEVSILQEFDIACFGDDNGSIEVLASGGTSFEITYSYTLYSGATIVDSIVDYESGTVLQTPFVFDSLSPGNYYVIAKDRNDCDVTSLSVEITEPFEPLTIMVDSVDETCQLNDGIIRIFPEGGGQSFNYYIIDINGDTTSNNTNTIEDNTPGWYDILVVDNRGCEIIDAVFIKDYQKVFMPDTLSLIDTTICLGQSINIDVDESPYLTYAWNDGVESGDRTIEPEGTLPFGETATVYYTLTITDANNCEQENIVVVNFTSINPMIGSNPGVEYGDYPIVLAGDNIDLFSNNNTCVEYTWQWNNEAITNANSLITIPELTATDWYYLNVKDVDGCLGYDSIYVVVGVKPYEAITPNNDGFNDTWTPLDIRSYQDALIQVFNRWGGLVFESNGGVDFQAWDGTNNGKELPVGTYYYIIDLNTGDVPQTGPVTIIR